MVEESLPILTMVISKYVDEKSEVLVEEQKSMVETLSMICSFLSIEDFVSFIYSEKFQHLLNENIPWIVFEIGYYQDHTKVIELIPTKRELIIADNQQTGVFEGNIATVCGKEDFVEQLSNWLSFVSEHNSRFQ